MKEKILFTCVGSTDPVRGLHDGPMLHIIRNYLPQKVYIVLSKEMEEFHNKDNRYNKAIQKFCVDNNFKIEVKFLPCCIKNVSDFDAFDKFFNEKLSRISEENPYSDILLNISSGTPQMTQNLCLLVNNLKFRNLKFIQVETPEKKSNTSDSNTKRNYNIDTEIKENEDNKFNSKRCLEPKLFTIKKAFVRKQVQILLDNYQYTSVKLLLKNYEFLDNSKSMKLIEHLIDRQNLKLDDAMKKVENLKLSIDLIPIENEKCKEETEYFLVLQNLCNTNKTTEFILRLNPFIIRMQELFLKKYLNFDCSEIKNEKSKRIKIERDKISKYNKELLDFLDRKSCKSSFRDCYPSIWAYNLIIYYFSSTSNNKEVKEYGEFFKKCEKQNNERNSSAHSLYGINEKDLKCISSQEILDKCKELLVNSYDKKCNTEIFNIYNKVNKLILENL